MAWSTRLVPAIVLVAAGLVPLCVAAAPPTLEPPDPPSIPWYRAQEAAAKSAALAARRTADEIAADGAAALPYDVDFYDLDLELDPLAQQITGRVALDARIGGTPLSAVLVDLDIAMSVDSVSVDGALATFGHTGDDLTVQLGRVYAAGEPFHVDIVYAGSPGAGSALHFDTRSGQPLIWTLSEPFGARTWWPCQDTPADKADSVYVDLTVPSGLTAVSNGALVSQHGAGGLTTFSWRERYPITPYLVSIAAHPYTQLATTYTPLGGGSMPVTLWSFPDQVGLATPFLVTTVQILERYASQFGEYPFVDEKYDIAQFPWSGGMEHQTATSQCCWSNFLTAHETGHQWFGDAITCENFQHVWLNEGFATYCEAVWDEGNGGTTAYRANIWANRYYGNGTIWVPPEGLASTGRIFDSSLSYNKPSWVLHTLRWVLGDGPFFDAVRAYLTSPSLRYGTATTEDFRAVVESSSGRDLGNFFDRWIYTPYYPTYLHAFTATPDAGGWRLDLTIEQIQTQGLYDLPVAVQVTTDAGTENFVVQVSAQSQIFSLDVATEPHAVLLDPDQWILCTQEAALPAPNFYRGLLVVNGASWSIGSSLTAAYADSVFSAGFPFEFWDEYAEPVGGYVPQLPPPRGHGAVPPEVLQEYSTVVWVGDGDLDFWNNTSIVSYLRAGGNLLFLGRRGQEFLGPSRASRLGLRWAESANATLASATAVYPGFVNMTRTGTQNTCAVFETSFDTPGTDLLLVESQSFGVPRGIAAWRRPPEGGTIRPGGGNFAFVSGRPYRWERVALRTNVHTILAQLFGVPSTPTGVTSPPAATRLLAPVPNPFNPSVAIGWELARTGPVRLVIYDAQGRQVRRLLDATRAAGPGRLLWDGRDDAGRSVASGTYLLRFEADGVIRSSKLTLLR